MPRQMVGKNFPLHMSEETKTPMENVSESGDAEGDNEEEEFIDAGTRLQLEKQKRADELRSQEVFMKRSTGIHKCSTCDWEFDEKKGDSFLIGGTVQPGTPFADLPSNWRCPSCRASKDNFQEVTEEIPGFEVNQGYGLGGNAMTSGQKSGLVFGGIFFFFVLMIGGYGLS
jgi:rubredoxin